MLANDLEAILRRVGIVFIVCVALQLSIDGRLVLLPFVAAVMAWTLRSLKPLADSPEAQRAWFTCIGCAWVTVAVGSLGLIPAIEAGAIRILVVIPVTLGIISYTSLMVLWARRAQWPDVEKAMDSARLWLIVTLGLTFAGILVYFTFSDVPVPGELEETYFPNVVFGRAFTGPAVTVGVLAVTVTWIVGFVFLGRGARKLHSGLKGQPDALVPLA